MRKDTWDTVRCLFVPPPDAWVSSRYLVTQWEEVQVTSTGLDPDAREPEPVRDERRRAKLLFRLRVAVELLKAVESIRKDPPWRW